MAVRDRFWDEVEAVETADIGARSGRMFEKMWMPENAPRVVIRTTKFLDF